MDSVGPVLRTLTLAQSSTGGASPPLTTVITAVDSASRTFLTTVTLAPSTAHTAAALTTVMTAVDSASRTVLTTLTLAPSSTPNIGDLVCSGIGGCASATRSVPSGEFTGAAIRDRVNPMFANSLILGLFGVAVAVA